MPPEIKDFDNHNICQIIMIIKPLESACACPTARNNLDDHNKLRLELKRHHTKFGKSFTG